MVREKSLSPRKTPRQTRAQITYDAVIDSAIQLLRSEGYDRLSTGRVAHEAGVSVGSLYQYFPNKAALGAAVIERCSESFLPKFTAALSARSSRTLADSVEAMVDATLVSRLLDSELHKIVIDLAPRIGLDNRMQEVSRSLAKAIENVLRLHQSEIDPRIDLGAGAIIIETLLEALAHNELTSNPEFACDEDVGREAKRLILGYLAVSA